METNDPYQIPVDEASKLLYSMAGGGKEQREQKMQLFTDECFVLTVPTGTYNREISSKLAADTAIWAYKLVRQRSFYWRTREKFLYRIFRTTNITMWQKKREKGYEQGLSADMAVVINSSRTLWIGSIGMFPISVYRNGSCVFAMDPSIDDAKRSVSPLGEERYGMYPKYMYMIFSIGDVLMLSTPNFARVVPTSVAAEILSTSGNSQEGLDRSVRNITVYADQHGVIGEYSVLLIRHCISEEIPHLHIVE